MRTLFRWLYRFFILGCWILIVFLAIQIFMTFQKPITEEQVIEKKPFDGYAFTANEMNQLIPNQEYLFMKDIQVSFPKTDTVQLNFTLPTKLEDVYTYLPKLKQYSNMLALVENAPVSVTTKIYLTNEKEVQLEIHSIQVAGLPVPESIYDSSVKSFNKSVNEFIDKKTGLKVDTLEIEKGVLYFKGELPDDYQKILENSLK